jgi:hypothetical protein
MSRPSFSRLGSPVFKIFIYARNTVFESTTNQCPLLGLYAAQNGVVPYRRFGKPICPISKGQAVQEEYREHFGTEFLLDSLTLEDGDPHRLYRNVGHSALRKTSKRAQISFAQRRKPGNTLTFAHHV